MSVHSERGKEGGIGNYIENVPYVDKDLESEMTGLGLQTKGSPVPLLAGPVFKSTVTYFLQEKLLHYGLETLADSLIQPVWLLITISLNYFCAVSCLLAFPLVEDYVENSMFCAPLLKQTTCR